MDSTIIGAIIGALATILGAFISKGYVERQVVTTQPTKPLAAPAASLLHILSKLSINFAQVIRIKEDQVYVSDDLEFSLVAEGIYPALGFADAKINIFGNHPQSIRFTRGEIISYQSTSGLHHFICTKLSSWRGLEIQIRQARQQSVNTEVEISDE